MTKLPTCDPTPPQVVSVNVGRPREVEWQGTVVTTAFFKTPVSGRTPIVGHNLDGDGQADREVHGGMNKTLFVYPLEHYDHWRAWLGTDDLPSGTFGENLTTSGLTEDTVAVGDRFRIGDAEVIVTEPRQPCYKVDVRLCRLGAAAEMIRSGRVGFYLGLVSPGTVASGDALQHVGGPETDRVSPAELHRLNTCATFEDLELIEHVSQLPEVESQWSEMLQVKATGLRRARNRQQQAWRGKRQFVVSRRVLETDDVVSVHLMPADEDALPPTVPGQFITINLPPIGEGVSLARSYTVSGDEPGKSWRITVRRAPDSEGGSERIHQLERGDAVQLGPPGGHFTLQEHPEGAPFIILSAGIGITPAVAFARELADREEAQVVAVHAMRTAEDHALLQELVGSIARCSKGRLVAFIEDGSRSDHVPAEDQLRGRPTISALRNILEQVGSDAHAYMCGPPGFMSAVGTMLVELGLAEGSIHSEEFLSPSADEIPVEVPGGGLEVSFAQRASTLLWSDADVSLLDLAEEADVLIPASCRQGVCGTCATQVLDGDVTYKRSPVAPIPEGMCLPCVAVPKTRLLLDA